jgi:hypothetical protein
MRTTINMNDELTRETKAYAARTGRTFSQVVEEAVAAYLSKKKKEPTKRFTLPPPVGDPNKKMTEEQYRAIVQDMYNDEAERIALPVTGDPKRRITPEQLKTAIAQGEFEDDMKNLAFQRRAHRK